MDKKIIEVGAACIFRNGKFLVQNRNGKSFADFLEFPGGKRESGETFPECVKRELYEELALEVAVDDHFYEETAVYNGVDFLIKFHHTQILSGEPNPMENQDVFWVSSTEFHELKFLPSNLNVLGILKNTII